MAILGRGKLGQGARGVCLSSGRVSILGERSLPGRRRSLEQEQHPGGKVLGGIGQKGHIQVLG